jgi:hypothetical protein
MTRPSRIQWRALSRRTVVIRSFACAAGAVASLPIKEAAAKMAQKGAEYQDTPKGDQQCSNCSLFQEQTHIQSDAAPPVVTASPCPHAPQIEGAYETIYPATLSTGLQNNEPTTPQEN